MQFDYQTIRLIRWRLRILHGSVVVESRKLLENSITNSTNQEQLANCSVSISDDVYYSLRSCTLSKDQLWRQI